MWCWIILSYIKWEIEKLWHYEINIDTAWKKYYFQQIDSLFHFVNWSTFWSMQIRSKKKDEYLHWEIGVIGNTSWLPSKSSYLKCNNSFLRRVKCVCSRRALKTKQFFDLIYWNTCNISWRIVFWEFLQE